MNQSFIKIIGLISCVSLLGACANTGPEQTTEDGLELQTDAKFDQLYLRPGASLAGYNQYALAPCDVSFSKNWLRDQNLDRANLHNRVSEEDVEKIKSSMSASCDKYLREALEEGPAYSLVDAANTDESVLILRPRIVDLDINAPDTNYPGINRSFTTSFGEMTLELDIADAATGEVLVRAVDRRRGYDRGYLQWTNGVTNKADSDRIIRRWAKQLRKGLDGAMETS